MRDLVAAGLALIAGCSEAPPANSEERSIAVSSPAAPSARDLAGLWVLSAPEIGACTVELTLEPAPPPPGLTETEALVARTQAGCAPAWAGLDNWAPAPLGLLLAAGGGRPLTFERTGPDVFAANGGTSPVLRRAPGR